jgi:arylsulfatase A-like enzyme
MVIALSVSGGCAEEAPPEVPARREYNVLLITLDTTRADRMSCYGHERRTTPNLDALAAEGVRFDMAIAQAAVTPVSHASILTGLLPPNHGVRVVYASSGYHLSPNIPTLSTVLAQAGWETAAFLSSFNVSEFFGFDNGFKTIRQRV